MTPGNGRQGFHSGPGSFSRKRKAPQVGLLLILGARLHLFWWLGQRNSLVIEGIFQEVSGGLLTSWSCLKRQGLLKSLCLSWSVCPKTCLKLAIPTFSVARALLTSCTQNMSLWLSCLRRQMYILEDLSCFSNFFLQVLDFLLIHFHFLKQLLLFLLPDRLSVHQHRLVADGLH